MIKITQATPNNIIGILEVQKTTWLATYINKEYEITTEDILSKDFRTSEQNMLKY